MAKYPATAILLHKLIWYPSLYPASFKFHSFTVWAHSQPSLPVESLWLGPCARQSNRQFSCGSPHLHSLVVHTSKMAYFTLALMSCHQFSCGSPHSRETGWVLRVVRNLTLFISCEHSFVFLLDKSKTTLPQPLFWVLALSLITRIYLFFDKMLLGNRKA